MLRWLVLLARSCPSVRTTTLGEFQAVPAAARSSSVATS